MPTYDEYLDILRKPVPSAPKNTELPQELVAAVMGVESGGNPNAVSPQNARGRMQVTKPAWLDYGDGTPFEKATDEQLFNAGVRKLEADYKHFGGDAGKTIAAYIGGRGAVRPDGSIRDDVADAHGTTPRSYTQRVMARMGTSGQAPQSPQTPQEGDQFLQAMNDYLREPVAAQGIKEQPQDGNFTRGMKMAWGQTGPTIKGAVGLLGATGEKAFGEGGFWSAVKDYGFKGYKDGMERLAPLQHENDDVTVAWKKAKEGNLGAMLDFLEYAAGYGVTQIGESAALAAGGALVGGASAGPIGAVAGGAGAALNKQATTGLIRNAVENFVAKAAGEIAAKSAGKIAIEQAIPIATKQIARNIGAAVALSGFNLAQEAGQIYPEAVEVAKKEGRDLTGSDIAKIWGYTTLSAGLESATDMLGINAALGKVKLPGGPAGRVANSVLMGIGGGLIEGGQEAGQTYLEWKGAGKETSGDQFRRDMINSAAMGAVPGAGFGGVVGAIHGGGSTSQPAPTPTIPAAEASTGGTTIDQIRQKRIDYLTGQMELLKREAGVDKNNGSIYATQLGPQYQWLESQLKDIIDQHPRYTPRDQEQAPDQQAVPDIEEPMRPKAERAMMAYGSRERAETVAESMSKVQNGRYIVIDHPRLPGRYAVVPAEWVGVVTSAPSDPEMTADEASARIEAAARQAKPVPDTVEQMHRAGVDQAQRNIEARGGVASPIEAKILEDARAGRPYDQVDPSLAPAEQKTSPRETQRVPSQQEQAAADRASEIERLDQIARGQRTEQTAEPSADQRLEAAAKESMPPRMDPVEARLRDAIAQQEQPRNEGGIVLEGHHPKTEHKIPFADPPAPVTIAGKPVQKMELGELFTYSTSQAKQVAEKARVELERRGVKSWKGIMEDIGPMSKDGFAAGENEAAGVRDASEVFEPEVIEKNAQPRWKSREKLVMMPIDDFLKMAERGEPVQHKASDLKNSVEKGEKLRELPYLLFSSDGKKAKITGHEGRHRARLLKSMGYTHMPVKFVGDIRWSEQDDPQKFDYRENWPETITTQNGEEMPFPVLRDSANTPYADRTAGVMSKRSPMTSMDFGSSFSIHRSSIITQGNEWVSELNGRTDLGPELAKVPQAFTRLSKNMKSNLNDIFSDLIKMGMPEQWLIGVRNIATHSRVFGNAVRARFSSHYSDTGLPVRALTVDRSLMESKYESVPYILRGVFSHEVGHSIDFNNNGKYISTTSPLFSAELDDNGGLLPTGPIMFEAFVEFAKDLRSRGPLADLLMYPFIDFQNAKEKGVEHYQKETFAQLASLFVIDPTTMAFRLPIAYRLFSEIRNETQRIGQLQAGRKEGDTRSVEREEELSRAVQRAFRTLSEHISRITSGRKQDGGSDQGSARNGETGQDASGRRSAENNENVTGQSRRDEQLVGDNFGFRDDAEGKRRPKNVDAITDAEFEAEIKKLGDRIAGMKSGETVADVRAIAKRLEQFAKKGIAGKEWYEKSAYAILAAFNGNTYLAEKFIQAIAITSAGTAVKANFTAAATAWEQFAQGKPIKVQTEMQNKKLTDLFYFGKEWEGRKTNTFYLNLTEAMYGNDSGFSTQDMHMGNLAFGHKNITTAQYELLENLTRLVAGTRDLNMKPRQLQASAWVVQKAKHLYDYYRERGWMKELSKKDLMAHVTEEALINYADVAAAKKWIPTVNEQVKTTSEQIHPTIRNVTVETIPSSKVKDFEFVGSLPVKDRARYSAAVMKAAPVDRIAELFGFDRRTLRYTSSTGGYDSNLSPNFVVELAPKDVGHQMTTEEVDRVRSLANALMYVYRQDAVPFFRADPALEAGVGNAQLGLRLTFASDLTEAKERKMFERLREALGENAGYTKTGPNEIVLINYRGDDGKPFLMDDFEFGKAVLSKFADSMIDNPVTSTSNFGAESEYPYHDWEKDPAGTSILAGLQQSSTGRSNIHERLRAWRDEAESASANWIAEERLARLEGSNEQPGISGGTGSVNVPTVGRRTPAVAIRGQKPDAQEVVGIHYSKEKLNELQGNRYGTGIKGAEARRLQYDPKLAPRVYFYTHRDTDVLPRPEPGLGMQAHRVVLKNMYPFRTDPAGVFQAMRDIIDPNERANEMERRIIAAGYDGYVNSEYGIAVVLGDVSIPVEYLGKYDRGTKSLVPQESALDRLAGSNSKPAWVEELPAAEQEAARKVGIYTPDKTWKQRIDEYRQGWKERVTQGIFDQYAPLKTLDEKSYVLARMTKGDDAGLEAIMMYGKPILNSAGALDVSDLGNGGVVKLLAELGGEHDRFLGWIAGRRAKNLKQAGRENLLSDTDISALSNWNQGVMEDGRNRAEVYADVHRRFQQFNKSVLDVAEKAGLIDGKDRAIWEEDFYVPFYRVLEQDGYEGPTNVGGLVNQYAFKRLRGGHEVLNDLFENTMRNWGHLISASLKNQAAKSSIKAAERAQIAFRLDSREKGAVSYREAGKQQWYAVEDPLIMDAITSLDYAGISGGPAMKLLQTAKHYLTFGVTQAPAFKLRNLIRDQVSAVALNPVSGNILSNALQGWGMTSKESDEYAHMLAGGGLMRFGTSLEGNRAKHIDRIVKMAGNKVVTTKEQARNLVEKLWDSWQELGDRSENITRASVYRQSYDQAIEAGKTPDEAHLIASFRARDSMDFGLQGKYQAIRLLSQIVPFFNARLQGLYKIGREGVAPTMRLLAGKGKPGDKALAIRFNAMAFAVSAASVLLMIAQKDDEDWKKREDWDRDTYWWVKAGDQAFRIPKPFELGAIGSMAERGVEAMMNGMRPEDRKLFVQRLGWQLSQTFAFNPTPQLVKPLIDLYANTNSFTGRPIETAGMENLSKSERIGPNTSALGQLLGKAGDMTGLSPVQIDSLINGYFSWLGANIMWMSDFVMRPAMGLPEKPAGRIEDIPVLGSFVRELPANQSRYVTMFYENANRLGQLAADVKYYQRLGMTEKAMELYENNKDDIAMSKMYEHVKRQIGELSQEVRRVQASSLTADEKRERIDVLTQRKNDLAKMVEDRRAMTEQ